MKKHQILSAARRKSGLRTVPKIDVVRHICEQLRVAVPSTWDARYELMRSWAVPAKSSKAQKVVAIAAVPVAAATKGESRRKRRQAERAPADAFLSTYEWRRLRMEVIKERGARCECCGSTPRDGIRINVDHIKPRRLFSELALEKSNLQVLCEVCNHGKGNWDQTDWREPPAITDQDVH